MSNKKLPKGIHKASIKLIRIIKRIEKGKKVVRLETTYHVENDTDYTFYSSIFEEKGERCPTITKI